MKERERERDREREREKERERESNEMNKVFSLQLLEIYGWNY